MTAREAVTHLRSVLPDMLGSHPVTTEAIAALIDHALRLEQALDLIRCAVTSALANAPENAILGRSR